MSTPKHSKKFTPEFNMPEDPEKTLGEEWHEEAMDESRLLQFLVIASALTAILLITFVLATQPDSSEKTKAWGSETKIEANTDYALKYFKKTEETKQDEVVETESTEEVAEEPVVEEEYYDEYYEEYYEPVYYEESYSGYSGGSTATSLDDLLNGQGRAYDENGTSYTYYGDVLGHLDIPGENVDENGVIHDGDGYIVVAADGYERGAVIETPYGDAKNYDSGGGYGNIDIYTNR